jgi:tetratricopeptide (TPR) repeat protein
MIKTFALRSGILGACLLQACVAPPVQRELLVQPALQVRHSGNETANAYYQMGKYHQERGDLELALTAFNYAIAREPRHLEARNAAASIHAQQGRLDQARAMMLAVVADFPRASQSHNNLGYIEYLRGDYAGASAAMRQALLIDPRNERARNNLRLAETALAGRAVPALAPQASAAPVLAAAAPAPASVAHAVPGPTMALRQVVPNVYELKRNVASASVEPKPAPAPVVARAEPKAVPAPAPAPVTTAAKAGRLVIANGNGAKGLARRASGMLGKHGMKVAAVVNERPFGQSETRIQYREGYRQQAEALRSVVRGKLVLVATRNMAANADVRLLLGKDAVAVLALRDAVTNAAPLAAR